MPTCFIISPISEPGGPPGQDANDLFDLFILPALARFDFHIIRADKLPRPNIVTNDTVELVQTAELCIIDLTGQDSNVFYACGRRHETGKPFVQLIRLGEALPFDLAGIRTVSYDLSSARAAHAATAELQSYVALFEASGYGPRQSEVSMATLAQAIDRLERKVDRLSPPEAFSTAVPPAEFMMEHPKIGVLRAIRQGRADVVAAFLPRLRELQGLTPELILPASLAARAGYDAGVHIQLEILETLGSTLDDNDFQRVIASLVDHYVVNDRETEGLDQLTQPILQRAERAVPDDPKTSAFLLNQLQKLLYGAGRYEEAERYGDRVVGLNPSEPSYWYNLSLIHEARGSMERAEEAIRKALTLNEEANPDEDHLSQAVEIFAARGLVDETRQVHRVLSAHFPARAEMLVRANPDVRSAVS